MAEYSLVGAKFVPSFANPVEWNSNNAYDELTVVMHNGSSYTSRQYVPVGTDITDTTYWMCTGNYNAQIDSMRSAIESHTSDTSNPHNVTAAQLGLGDVTALVGSETGTVVHVVDAFAGAALRGITVEGACKQDGTPSPDNPVPIQVIENPVVKVTGADTSAVSTSTPFTLPAEHPYLAKLPDGTADTIDVDKDGNTALLAKVGKSTAAVSDGVGGVVGTDAMSSTGAIAEGAVVYYKLATPATYALAEVTVPSLPDSTSNVWTDAEVTPNTSIEYVRDVNIVVSNLESAIASITQS